MSPVTLTKTSLKDEIMGEITEKLMEKLDMVNQKVEDALRKLKTLQIKNL
jgi:hypothetical protein